MDRGWKTYTDRRGVIRVKGKCGSCGVSLNGMSLDQANRHYMRCTGSD